MVILGCVAIFEVCGQILGLIWSHCFMVCQTKWSEGFLSVDIFKNTN